MTHSWMDPDGIRRSSGRRATMRHVIRLAACCAILSAWAAQPLRPAFAAGDWNDAGIRWRPYATALAEAKQSHKPICLVFYADWCPHCTNYSRMFHAREVVAASRRFVMVRLDADVEERLSRKYAFDGAYIPRTYFLSPDGTPNPTIHAFRDRYKYFYDEDDPASLLAGMSAARRLSR